MGQERKHESHITLKQIYTGGYFHPIPQSRWLKEVMIIPMKYVFEKLFLRNKILFYFMHKTKLIFLLVLTDLLYHSHSAVMYGYSLTDSSVKFTLSMLSVSLDSSNRSSCLSFPHTYLLWLSQQIIEASWLVAS